MPDDAPSVSDFLKPVSCDEVPQWQEWWAPSGQEVNGYKVLVQGLPPFTDEHLVHAWIYRSVAAGAYQHRVGLTTSDGRCIADPLGEPNFERLYCTDIHVTATAQSGACQAFLTVDTAEAI